MSTTHNSATQMLKYQGKDFIVLSVVRIANQNFIILNQPLQIAEAIGNFNKGVLDFRQCGMFLLECDDYSNYFSLLDEYIKQQKNLQFVFILAKNSLSKTTTMTESESEIKTESGIKLESEIELDSELESKVEDINCQEVVEEPQLSNWERQNKMEEERRRRESGVEVEIEGEFEVVDEPNQTPPPTSTPAPTSTPEPATAVEPNIAHQEPPLRISRPLIWSLICVAVALILVGLLFVGWGNPLVGRPWAQLTETQISANTYAGTHITKDINHGDWQKYYWLFVVLYNIGVVVFLYLCRDNSTRWIRWFKGLIRRLFIEEPVRPVNPANPVNPTNS